MPAAQCAPRPQTVRYENLATRFAFSTKARRGCANLVLILIVLVSLVVSLLAVTAKNSADLLAAALVAGRA